MPSAHPRHGEPGDILVIPIPDGFMLGRVLPELGPGPWWEYIKIATDQNAALEEARLMAHEAKVRAWLHRDGDEYAPIPVKES